MAKKYERPFQYLSSAIRKEDNARELAQHDGIEEGLVCIFSILEPCRTFSFRFQKGGPFVRSARRKCLHLYFYFMDRDFGLIHVRIQTWFPMQIQIYLNGHEWLARKLSANHLRYTKHDNVFLWIEDMAKAQRFADGFASLNWPVILNQYAKRVNPQMRDILHDRPYYWVSAQSEYSTDMLFNRRQDRCELYPQLLSHSTLCFGAREVMNFLGRKLHGKFEGEIISDLSSLVCRRTGGSRIKHRVKENWLKMYDSRVLFFGWKPSSTIPRNSGYARRSRAKASVKPNGLRCARESLTYSAIVRSRSKPTAVISMRWRWSTIPPTRNGISTASPLPKRMRRAVGAPVSIRSHDTTLNYSKASWPVTTACEGSRTATSGHGLHQRVISGPAGTIP